MKGCGHILIIDGNMKNHRSVCAASEAGYIEYAGLTGSVKSGCTNTPEQRSRFCSLHKPRALLSDTETHKVIETILQKRTTRSENSYQVFISPGVCSQRYSWLMCISSIHVCIGFMAWHE